MDMARLGDLEEIRQLSYRYAWGWDTGQIDLLLGVFTPDAVWDESAVGVEPCRGHGEIRAIFEKFRPAMTGGSMHPTVNHMINFTDSDHATGICYFLGDVVTSEGAEISAHGAFEDTYVRTADGWRVTSRVARALLPPKTSDLP